MSTFAERLNLLRKEKKWTQDKLAELLDISKSTISMYENGNRTPSFEIEEQIADLFNVDLEYLRGRSNSRNREYDHYIAELKTMASKIRARRIELDYSYGKLAEMTGISASSLNRYETGNIRNLPIDKFELLAVALKLDPAKLFNEVRNDRAHQSNADIITTIKIPTFGKASAGNGYLNLSEEVDTFEIPSNMYKPGMFAVNVTGDSMTSSTKSIPDGTVAVADPTMCTSPDSLNGRICVFTYNDETFIKQLVINTDGIIRLRSFNSEYEDILVLKPKQLKCEGRVISTFTKQTW